MAWPGEYVGDTFVQSEQQVIIYTTRAEDETSTQGGITPFSTTQLPVESVAYFKNGDTLYFPGKTTKVQFYDAGDSQFKDEAGGHGYVPGTDGAIVVTLSPRLPFKPGKITTDSATDTDQKNCWGLVIYEGNLTLSKHQAECVFKKLLLEESERRPYCCDTMATYDNPILNLQKDTLLLDSLSFQWLSTTEQSGFRLLFAKVRQENTWVISLMDTKRVLLPEEASEQRVEMQTT